jgi:hypothetical protein
MEQVGPSSNASGFYAESAWLCSSHGTLPSKLRSYTIFQVTSRWILGQAYEIGHDRLRRSHWLTSCFVFGKPRILIFSLNAVYRSRNLGYFLQPFQANAAVASQKRPRPFLSFTHHPAKRRWKIYATGKVSRNISRINQKDSFIPSPFKCTAFYLPRSNLWSWYSTVKQYRSMHTYTNFDVSNDI